MAERKVTVTQVVQGDPVFSECLHEFGLEAGLQEEGHQPAEVFGIGVIKK